MVNLESANENPWYVLMTLFGEQHSINFNHEKQQKNRSAWNAWACQNMSEEQQEKVAENATIELAELQRWGELETEIKQLHKKEMCRRNHNNKEFIYPGLPDVGEKIDFADLEFFNEISFGQLIFNNYTRSHWNSDKGVD